MSFPGGVIEESDRNSLETCYRETEEEIGIRKGDIDILGELKPQETSTGFYIHSFVGFLNNLTDLKINHDEVERLIYIPIKWLNNPDNSYTETFIDDNHRIHRVISFKLYEGEKLWGITAKIVKQFLEIV
jgi:8-oxo-dGTP pyrophosphatase MutT (NUDIX family)